MAATAPSPLASSVDKTNGAKLRRLLIDGGTTILRNVFDGYHPPANLAADLTANYVTLYNLKTRRVLHQPQWDLLFPISGVPPDSTTFDITLLFLLLTNICGLTPPSSGWHTKPPPTDTSTEANLARIKFFRNELHGHATGTGVDTPTFNALWLEISAVLTAVGLNQTEIDRLKAERCGEDDYLDVLHEWADSDKDIKLELRDIRQLQTETQQDVQKVLETQQEDRKSHEDTNSVVEELHKIDINTNEVVKEARGTQLEDHKTLKDSVLKLEGISQCQTETHQAVEEIHETLQAGLQEVKQEVENLKNRKEKDKGEKVLKKLAKSEFKGDIEHHAQRFQDGTREWIFERVEEWLDDRSSQNRVMVISGNAGMGKSVISAVICKRMQDAGRLSGSHFCQHNNVRYRNPQLMLQSLACHLSIVLPEYKDALVEQLSRNLGPVELNSMGVEELFALLFNEPLNKVADPGRNMLMVIDGLDESEFQGRNELLDVIANQFCKLPQWIRFFVTTRPEINIADSLKHFQPIKLEENQDENSRDIQHFFGMQLSHKIEDEHKDVFLGKLVDKSEGVFLYAYFLTDFIQKNVSLFTPEELETSLPLGVSSVYLSHFKRLEKELSKELNIDEDQMSRFLCALTASMEPLPVAFVPTLLNLSGRSLPVQRKINKAIASISSLLPVCDDCLHFFHKSVKDWLTNTSCYGRHDFTVDEREGHEILFDLCKDELDNIKRKGVEDTQFNVTERYALQHGVQHMIEVDSLTGCLKTCLVEEMVNVYVTDLELIYAKLCVNSSISSEDISCVQRHLETTLRNEESHSSLMCLLKVLRKNAYMLRDHPHLWFQSVFNDGTPKLSSRAAGILENRFSSVTYMKYLDTDDQGGAVQARFYCSDTVACFDVSPQLDYMVCECRDGTIHLWSLETGNKEWTRPSLIKRKYQSVFCFNNFNSPKEGAYRGINFDVLTYYRSVAFHPSGTSVLPGTLRSVYTLKGNCTDLFPNSYCTFSHCAFPGDKRTILTDCFDDPKTVVLWSMENGEGLKAIQCDEDISSFAISQDGSRIAIGDMSRSVYLVDVDKWQVDCVFTSKYGACGLMHFTPDNEALVCGYLHFRTTNDIGGCQLAWESDVEPSFFICDLEPCPSLASFGGSTERDFHYWPIEPTALTIEGLLIDGLLSTCTGSAFPSLQAGFYKKLNKVTTLVGSPSFKHLLAVNVHMLNELDFASTREAVREVVFSREGDAIYSICAEDRLNVLRKDSQLLVTVFRMSSLNVLTKRYFTCQSQSLSLLPMKEGIVFFWKDQVPELWNVELTECIRPLARLTGAERLIRVSDELIACQLPRRRLTPDEMSWDLLTELTESLRVSEEDDSLKSTVNDTVESGDSSDDSSNVDDSLDFDFCSGPEPVSIDDSSLCAGLYFSFMQIWEPYRMLAVDIINVTSGECVSSVKTTVRDENTDVVFISCNSQSQLLMCTVRYLPQNYFGEEVLTLSLRNNNGLKCVWQRSTTRYEDEILLSPGFVFSADEVFVATWHTFDSSYGLHILDAKTGITRHTLLKEQNDIIDCKPVVNCDTLVCCSGDNLLRLLNVRTGHLLTVLDIEERHYSLGACLGKPLVAIGLSGTRMKFVHVELPRAKDTDKKKD